MNTGLRDHKTTGPQDHRTAERLRDHRTTGPQDHRTRSPWSRSPVVRGLVVRSPVSSPLSRGPVVRSPLSCGLLSCGLLSRGPTSERGVALVITLILLSVITFMAFFFLVAAPTEKGSVTTETDQTTAKL